MKIDTIINPPPQSRGLIFTDSQIFMFSAFYAGSFIIVSPLVIYIAGILNDRKVNCLLVQTGAIIGYAIPSITSIVLQKVTGIEYGYLGPIIAGILSVWMSTAFAIIADNLFNNVSLTNKMNTYLKYDGDTICYGIKIQI